MKRFYSISNYVLLFCLLLAFVACNPPAEQGHENSPQAGPPKRYMRKNVYSEAAQRDIEAFAVAIDAMKKLDCSDPRSWYYQGAIHWAPDSIYGPNQLCSSYQTTKDIKAGWNNCTHTPSGAEEIHFLVWHRLYIYYLERIMRKLSGYEDFALPYWAYTNTDNIVQNRTLPPAWRDSSSTLFEASRFDTLNMGLPVVGSTSRKLGTKVLFQSRLYSTFNSNFDKAPHGAMHNYMGYGNDTTGKQHYNRIWQKNSLGMICVIGTTGFDPLFWIHHANVDRVWQQWTNSANGQRVTLEELKSAPWSYTFFDENGQKVEWTMEQIIDTIYKMDYDYDDAPMQPKAAPKHVMNLKAVAAKDTLGKLASPFALKRGGLLALPRNGGDALALAPSGDAPGKVLVLRLQVAFSAPPIGDFEIYLNLPKGTQPDTESDYYVGDLNFFGADHHASMAGHHGHGAHGMTKTYLFDLTHAAIATKALARKTFDFSFVGFGRHLPEDIRIEKLAVIAI